VLHSFHFIVIINTDCAHCDTGGRTRRARRHRQVVERCLSCRLLSTRTLLLLSLLLLFVLIDNETFEFVFLMQWIVLIVLVVLVICCIIAILLVTKIECFAEFFLTNCPNQNVLGSSSANDQLKTVRILTSTKHFFLLHSKLHTHTHTHTHKFGESAARWCSVDRHVRAADDRYRCRLLGEIVAVGPVHRAATKGNEGSQRAGTLQVIITKGVLFGFRKRLNQCNFL
jgi:hypothetical protein